MKTQVFASRRFESTHLFELGLIIALSSLILILQVNKKFSFESKIHIDPFPWIDVKTMPQTTVEKKIAIPKPPSVPIPSEIEEDIKEYDIDDIMNVWGKISNSMPLPPDIYEPEDPAVFFTVFEKPPVPIGGMNAIRDNLIYPEIARKAGVEGRVTVLAYIDETGKVVKTEILQSLGPNGCDEAAMRAVSTVRWEPAMQRDRPVRVKIAIPIDFKLSKS